jgi:CDP-glycerol glycerophosphotransferase (TagB/SpsB family)
VYLIDTLYAKLILLRAGAVLYTHSIPSSQYAVGAEKVYLMHGDYLKHMGVDNRPKSETSALKRVEQRVGELLGKPDTFYTITSTGKPREIVQSAYDPVESNLLVTGFPRKNVLFGPIENEQLGVNSSALQELSEIPDSETVIFYMPTHRQAFGKLAGKPLSDIVFDFEQMDDFLTANDAHLYISLPPYTELEWDNEYDRIEQLDPRDDVYPFLRQADMLMTDYSSVFYDLLLIDRPVLFYAPDFEAYVSSRGLYVDYQSHIPGPLTRSTTELLGALEAQMMGDLNYAEHRGKVLEEYYHHRDGQSAERVYDAIRTNVIENVD